MKDQLSAGTVQSPGSTVIEDTRFRLPTFAYGLLMFSIGCAPLKPVEFQAVTDVKVENAFVAPHVTGNLIFFNPNSIGCTARDFNLDLSLNEIKLTTLSFNRQRIPASSQFELPLSTSLSYGQLVRFIPLGVASIQGGKEIPVALNGTITLKKFFWKKTFPFEYHGKISTDEISIK